LKLNSARSGVERASTGWRDASTATESNLGTSTTVASAVSSSTRSTAARKTIGRKNSVGASWVRGSVAFIEHVSSRVSNSGASKAARFGSVAKASVRIGDVSSEVIVAAIGSIGSHDSAFV